VISNPGEACGGADPEPRASGAAAPVHETADEASGPAGPAPGTPWDKPAGGGGFDPGSLPDPAGYGGERPAAEAPAAEEPAANEPAAEEFRGALEAILLIVDEPVAAVTLAQVLERPTDEVVHRLRALQADYHSARRGFELRETEGAWRLYTRPEYAGYVQRFIGQGHQARLSRPALETLAVIAYQQPVTRARVAAVRGVNADGVVRTLLARGLVEEAGTEPETGAILYRTTTLFLERMGLAELTQLPPLAEFLPDHETLDEQID
jgi:segregation and condensation protein B